MAVCAAKIPDRLRAAVIVSGAWRMDWPEARKHLPSANRLAWDLARKAPFLQRLFLVMMRASFKRSRKQILAQLKKHFPASDYAVLEQPGRLDAVLQTYSESMRQGTKGPGWDMRLYVREWDFCLDEIRMPLKLFHGEQDRNVPIALVRRTITLLPSARLVTYENEAHISLIKNHFDQIAKALTGD